MTIQQLRILGYLAECGSISKAAELCFLSQSALTRQIRSMEEELGYPLLIRSFNGVTLTPAGQKFYESTRKIIADYDTAVLLGKAVSCTPVKKTIRVGVYNYSLHFISQIAKLCETRLPHISLDYVSCRMTESGKYLNDHQLDLCFPAEYMPDHAGIAHTDFFMAANCCRIPVGHPLFDRENLSLSDLQGHTVLLLPRGVGANADRLRARIEKDYPAIRIADYLSTVQADALALSKQYILLTLGGLFDKNEHLHTVSLSDVPPVALSALYRKSDQQLIEPLLGVIREYLDETPSFGDYLTKL